MMSKKIAVILVIALGVLVACFFCCRKTATVENVLDEMYTCICMNKPSRYTQASFYGLQNVSFAKPETNVGQPWKEHFEHPLENGWMTGYFFRDMKIGLDTVIVSNDGTRLRMYLDYDVKTKKMETLFTSDITDITSAEYQALKKDLIDGTIRFFDKWIEVNEGNTLFSYEKYGDVFCVERNAFVELRQYVDGLK